MRIFTENQMNERAESRKAGNAPGNRAETPLANTFHGKPTRRSTPLAAVLAVSTLIPCAWGMTSAGAQTPDPTGQASGQATDQAQYGNAQSLCQPEVIGNRRIPKESVLARLFSHAGNLYDPAIVERDFNSLWNTGYFEDVRIEKVEKPSCVQLIVYVKEKPTIRELN